MYRPRFPQPQGPRPPFYGNQIWSHFNGPVPQRFDGPPPMNGQRHGFQPRNPDHRGPRMRPPLSPSNFRGPSNFPDTSPCVPSPGQVPSHRFTFNGGGGNNNGPRGFGPPQNYGQPRQHRPQGSPGPWGRFPGPRGQCPPREVVEYGDLAKDPPHSYGNRGRGGMMNRKRNAYNRGDSGPTAKKQCVNKRELPENNQYYCETCDRGFKTEEKYKEHVNGHEQCSVEGCSYKAAPKLVSLHYKWQHQTGLAKKIWQLESKEDIEKWRKERKTNYPTAATVAKKESLMKERERRGEVLETKTFGKMRGRGRGRGGRGGRGGKDRPQDSRGQQVGRSVDDKGGSDQKKPGPAMSTSNVEEKQDGDPLSILLTSQPTNSDSDDDKNEKIDADETKVVAAGGLGDLVASYGNITDSDNEGEKKPPNCDKVPTQQVKDETNDKNSDNPKHSEGRHQRRHNRSRGKGRSKGSKEQMANPKRKSSLLEKLLAPEIRHERNVILQCVRHIIKNNFLGVGPKPLTELKVRQALSV